jgi:hypothetical protein
VGVEAALALMVEEEGVEVALPVFVMVQLTRGVIVAEAVQVGVQEAEGEMIGAD